MMAMAHEKVWEPQSTLLPGDRGRGKQLSAQDRLTSEATQLDIFQPGSDQRAGSDQRVFDFSGAEYVRGESLPRGRWCRARRCWQRAAATSPGRCLAM